MPTLSKREKTVLELIAEGLSSPEIAERLHLSGRTVEWHSAKVMNKLGAKNRIQAVVIAICNSAGIAAGGDSVLRLGCLKGAKASFATPRSSSMTP